MVESITCLPASGTEREASSDQPPPTNRGAERTRGLRVGLRRGAGRIAPGWLAGTFRMGWQAALVMLADRLGGAAECETGVLGYQRAWRVGPNGSLLAVQPKSPDVGRVRECYLQLKGADCLALGWVGVRELGGILERAGFRCTRFDISWDDAERRVEPGLVWRAFKSGQVVTRLDWRGKRRGKVKQQTRRVENLSGEGTTYLGSGASAELLRIYDKDQEQGVAPGTYGIRWELQLNKGRGAAHSAWQRFQRTGSAQKRAAILAQLLVDHCDFRDREAGQAHGERAARLPWFGWIVGRVQRARSAGPKMTHPLGRKLAWLRFQVAPTLALFLHLCGGELGPLLTEVKLGEARLKPEQWLLLPPELRPSWVGGPVLS